MAPKYWRRLKKQDLKSIPVVILPSQADEDIIRSYSFTLIVTLKNRGVNQFLEWSAIEDFWLAI